MSSALSSKARLKTIAVTPKHVRDKKICSTLTDDLREQYRRRSIRVIKGDTVRVMRGEYTGIEGKVEKVNTTRGTLSIEGVQREKVRGGNVKVQIHSSSVRVSGLNLDDKYRQDRVRGQDEGQDAQNDTSLSGSMDNNDKNSDKKKRNLDIGNTLKKGSLVKKGSRKKNNNNKAKKNPIKDNEGKNKTSKKNNDDDDNYKSQLNKQSNEEKGG